MYAVSFESTVTLCRATIQPRVEELVSQRFGAAEGSPHGAFPHICPAPRFAPEHHFSWLQHSFPVEARRRRYTHLNFQSVGRPTSNKLKRLAKGKQSAKHGLSTSVRAALEADNWHEHLQRRCCARRRPQQRKLLQPLSQCLRFTP